MMFGMKMIGEPELCRRVRKLNISFYTTALWTRIRFFREFRCTLFRRA